MRSRGRSGIGTRPLVRERAVINRHARIMGQQAVQVLLKTCAVDRVRLDRNDVVEIAFCLPDKRFDHDTMMSAGVEQDFVVAQCSDNFRNEKPVACR